MKALESLYANVLVQLPIQPDEPFLLNGSLCAAPPDEILTSQLKVVPWPLGHGYGDSARYDAVHFFADKNTYRRLGLLLFANMFHPNREVILHLSHPQTAVTKIRIDCVVPNLSNARLMGLASRPLAFGYEPSPVTHLHPLWKEEWRIQGQYEKYSGRAAYHLPDFYLTNETRRCGNADDFASRRIIDGFGGPEATATLAALLLDIGLPQTALTEFCLESPSGNWSVAIGSAEAKFHVGSDHY